MQRVGKFPVNFCGKNIPVESFQLSPNFYNPGLEHECVCVSPTLAVHAVAVVHRNAVLLRAAVALFAHHAVGTAALSCTGVTLAAFALTL